MAGDLRRCAHCNTVLVQRPGEPAYRFRDRTACGVECGRKTGGAKGRTGVQFDTGIIREVSSGFPEGVSFR